MTMRPSWVTPWGVVAIVVGVYGIFAGASASVMPRMLKMQREMMGSAFDAQAAREGEAPADDAAAQKRARDAETMKRMSGQMLKMFELTPAQERWIVVAGAIGTVLSGLYILAAAFVLQLRTLGVKLFAGAVGAKIALALAGFFFVPAATGAWMLVPGALMGVVAHGVMLTILLVNARDLAPRSEPPAMGALG